MILAGDRYGARRSSASGAALPLSHSMNQSSQFAAGGAARLQGPRPRALAGRNTANSVPGGIFARNPEQDGHAILEAKRSIEGTVNGRFNTSSVAGGIFAGQPPPVLHASPDKGVHLQNSIPGGIFAQPPPTAPSHLAAERDKGPILGGGGATRPVGMDGAAGGRASNASQLRDGHTRGNLHGRTVLSDSTLAGLPSREEGAFARLLEERGGGLAPQIAPPPQPPQPPQSQPHDSFLERVAEAERRDGDDLEVLAQLHELEEQAELIEAAAAQIAHEERLGPQAQEALRLQMLARVRDKAQALRAQLMQAANDERLARPAAGQPARPGMGTLEGILARASPRGELATEAPNPIKGRGACNPLPTGASRAPYDMFDAAGQGAADGWRSGSGGSSGGGGADGRQLQAQLRLEHRNASRPQQHPQASSSVMKDTLASKSPARILYPGSDVMVRGKHPGY